MSTTSKAPVRPAAGDYRITSKSKWSGAWRIAGGIGALGLGISAYGYKVDPDRFAFSYLFGFFVALSLALGSMFFVLVHYAVKAAWSVTVRRVAELFMRPMPIFAVLAIPLVLQIGHLFPWLGSKHVTTESSLDTSAEQAPNDGPLAEMRGYEEREPAAMRDLPVRSTARMDRAEEHAEALIIKHKSPYMNKRLFLIRLIGYLIIWSWIVHRYFGWSTAQDKDKALENTAAGQRFAPVALILFGLTLTFFAFDWLLSLDATWYSTIFGVTVFAQCALFQMAAMILMALALRRSGLLGDAVNVEHFHDMGKLLFGWIVFWSYVSFAQFFLTWYSNIPDEVEWFQKRWHDNGGTWEAMSITIVLMHFFIPFWFLMSRNMKRKLPMLATGAVCLVIMHVVEVYWIIMPNIGPLQPTLVDFGCLIGVFGVYMAFVLYGMEEYPLVAIGDPKLTRALEFENA